MEGKVLVRLLKNAIAINTFFQPQYTETIDITANGIFKNIINLYIDQQLQLYANNKASWNDLKLLRTDNVRVRNL